MKKMLETACGIAPRLMVPFYVYRLTDELVSEVKGHKGLCGECERIGSKGCTSAIDIFGKIHFAYEVVSKPLSRVV
jgi:hypothetical protein